MAKQRGMNSYLDELDDILCNQIDDGMLLSELDGFLTGVIVSPDLVPPSRWLKPVLGSTASPFEDSSGMQRFLDLMMEHYNGLVESLNAPGGYEPILDTDPRSGEVLWELWVDGFVAAMKLAPAGWNRIRASDDAGPKAAIAGIMELAAISEEPFHFREDDQDRRTAVLIPIWVHMLHEWRLENDRHRPASAKGKVGRNDPCPCGSGKKYKKCCGLN